MADGVYSEYQSSNVVAFRGGRMGAGDPPGPPLEPPSGGGGGDMEARVRVLETHVEYIKAGIARIEKIAESSRNEMSDLNVKIATLTANVAHLPSKTMLFTAATTTVALIVGILTILSRFGFLTAVSGK